MNKTYVLDANALLDLLVNGPGAERVEHLLRSARPATPLLVSAVNWGEVFYISWQRHGEESARQTLADAQNPIRRQPRRRTSYPESGHARHVRPRFRETRTPVSGSVDRPLVNDWAPKRPNHERRERFLGLPLAIRCRPAVWS